MAFSSATPPSAAGQKSTTHLGFLQNAKKHKHSFIQFFAMTGILLLSVRSLGQKYRIYDLQEDNYELKEEQESLSKRMKNIKQDLLHEASLESTGQFASRLRLLFSNEEDWSAIRILIFLWVLCFVFVFLKKKDHRLESELLILIGFMCLCFMEVWRFQKLAATFFTVVLLCVGNLEYIDLLCWKVARTFFSPTIMKKLVSSSTLIILIQFFIVPSELKGFFSLSVKSNQVVVV